MNTHNPLTAKTDASLEALRRRYVRLCRPMAVVALVVGSLPFTGPLALLCVTLSVAAFVYVIKTALDYYDSQAENLAQEQIPQSVGAQAEDVRLRATRYGHEPVMSRAAA